MTTTLEITPALLSMRVLAVADDAVYIRLPEELQRPTGSARCDCTVCQGRTPGNWDTLVVPTQAERTGWSYTVHMPEPSVKGFRDYLAKKGKLVR